MLYRTVLHELILWPLLLANQPTSEFAGATQSFGMPATVLDPYTRVLASVADGKHKDKCLSIIVEMSSLHNCRAA